MKILQRSSLALLVALSVAACAPTHQSFLQDAASTCGNPDLVFPEQRTFETPVPSAKINSSYDCVQKYLHASPEYQASITGQEVDAGYVDGLRRIDLARSANQISPAEAKAESLRLYRHYKTTVGE